MNGETVALILNSGLGHRMGDLTASHPKCMTELGNGETILSRQLRLLWEAGIRRTVMTTGYLAEVLEEYARALTEQLPGMEISFVYNPEYRETNYIYSVYLAGEPLGWPAEGGNGPAARDILSLHGDLVFEQSVLEEMLNSPASRMKVSAALPLPEKDFKAVVDDAGRVEAVGVRFFDRCLEAQALYRLTPRDAGLWMGAIRRLVESGRRDCYAEDALNELMADPVAEKPDIRALDVGTRLCAEVDTPEDLEKVTGLLSGLEEKAPGKDPSVYMCFSTDMIHSGHIALIRRAAKLGRLTVGVLSDEAVASYRRFPLMPFAERKVMFENIAGVDRVVAQETLSYRENLEKYRPDYVVHGDDWLEGVQRPIREEVIRLLGAYGGRLVEFPYARDSRYAELEARARRELSMPDMRRARLRKLLGMKGLVTAMEAHSGLTGLLVEKTVAEVGGETRQFDAMWISSLCDSTSRGKPDIELVDMSSRFRTVDEICEVTTKPIIFDGDTGGLTEHFVYAVRSLERMGVSMVIIEDKTGLKKNSLFGTEVAQTQDSIEHFSQKIAAGKRAQRTKEFMICARIESLILERGMEDALERAFAFVKAGADAIMIHSRRKDPAEIFEFVARFRAADGVTPLVVVPTSFNSVTEEEFRSRGVNVVIYANQLTRSGFPAMEKAARSILVNRRGLECDEICMPFKEIIRLIPEE